MEYVDFNGNDLDLSQDLKLEEIGTLSNFTTDNQLSLSCDDIKKYKFLTLFSKEQQGEKYTYNAPLLVLNTWADDTSVNLTLVCQGHFASTSENNSKTTFIQSANYIFSYINSNTIQLKESSGIFINSETGNMDVQSNIIPVVNISIYGVQ